MKEARGVKVIFFSDVLYIKRSMSDTFEITPRGQGKSDGQNANLLQPRIIRNDLETDRNTCGPDN